MIFHLQCYYYVDISVTLQNNQQGNLTVPIYCLIHAKNKEVGTFFFYHAPSIGGDNGLRGFRDERFTGRSYFFHSSNIKLKLKQYITPVSPVTVGLYGGFDYGRVSVPDDSSQLWHTSQGLGFWISSLKALTFNAGYFNSKENNIVQVGLGLSF